MKPITPRMLVAEYYKVGRKVRLKLPPVSIRFGKTLPSALAYCTQYPRTGKVRKVVITLDPSYKRARSPITRTALYDSFYHEIAHVVARKVYGHKHGITRTHGPSFRRAMERLMKSAYWWE